MQTSMDTDPRAARVQIELLRRMGAAGRFALVRSLTATVIGLAREGIRRARPELSEQEVLLEFAALHYGAELAEGLSHRLSELGR